MKSSDNINELVKSLHLKASADLDKRVHQDISRRLVKSERSRWAIAQPDIWRTILRTKTARFAAAAVIAFVVIGGMTFWPSHKKWWLAPPAVWSQEIINALDTFKCVTCREQLVDVEPDGTEHTSMTWFKYYGSNDSYRRDIYDNDVLREIQWYVPDGGNMVQHSVRFDLESYFAQTHTGSFGNYDPVERLRSCVSLMDEADRLLGTEFIEGCECVGFEISASKYGDNPGQRIDCIWFDVETKLPVRIEKHGRPVTGQADMTVTIIQDQFDYDPGFSADTFVPYTPEGFVFSHPDDIQADRKK